MGEELVKALDEYERIFDDSFPTLPLCHLSGQEMKEIVDRCISEKKDVYELGYLDINAIY